MAVRAIIWHADACQHGVPIGRSPGIGRIRIRVRTRVRADQRASLDQAMLYLPVPPSAKASMGELYFGHSSGKPPVTMNLLG